MQQAIVKAKHLNNDCESLIQAYQKKKKSFDENPLVYNYFCLLYTSILHNPLDLICIPCILICLLWYISSPYYLDIYKYLAFHHRHIHISWRILFLSWVFYMADKVWFHPLWFLDILQVLWILHPDWCYVLNLHRYSVALYTHHEKQHYRADCLVLLYYAVQIHVYHRMSDLYMQSISVFLPYGSIRFLGLSCLPLLILSLFLLNAKLNKKKNKENSQNKRKSLIKVNE